MIVQKDLIPILIEYKDNDKIAMAVGMLKIIEKF